MAKGEYPWEHSPHIWKTESSFMSWVRGGIRRGLWEKHPIKLEMLTKEVIMVDNTNPRSKKRFPKVKAYKCNMCKDIKRASEVEVDHLDGHHSLRSIEDIDNFIKGIVLVKKESLQILCKPCHNKKSYAERMGLSIQDAAKELDVVSFKKLKAKEQIKTLNDLGVAPEKNGELRVKQYRSVIFKED